MALEHSIFHGDDLVSFLNTHYGLTVTDHRRLKLGTANCYRITADGKPYFLKEFQSGIDAGTVEREAGLVAHLAERGIPVARVLPTRDGALSVYHGGHVICLEDYIEGIAYGYDDFPPAMLGALARMLGRIHVAMRDVTLPPCEAEDYAAEKVAAQYEALLADAEAHRQDKHYARIIADLTYKRELAYRCADYRRYHEGITYLPTHGDYQGCQLICGEGEIRAVVDFSSARILPAVWEIIRSYVQSSQDCRRHATLYPNGLCDYVREYLRVAPLTERDMVAMPYVYLFQLARSKYGYPQYLHSDSEDRVGLLHFAFWRTDMCRELERRAPEISEVLVGLLR